MVYCAAFDCNVNSSKNKVTCSWFMFPTEPTLFKKENVKPALLTSRKLVLTAIRTRKGAALGYPATKINLKDDDVPTLFPVVEAMLIPLIRRTLAVTKSSTTTVHLGLKRAVSTDTGDVGLW